MRSARLLAVLMVITAPCLAASAQDRPGLWLGLGLGAGGGFGGRDGASLMAELVYQERAHHLALRGVFMTDVFGKSGDSFGELGVLYGRGARGKFAHAAIAAGAALTFTPCAHPRSGECSTLGLPVVAEAAFRPLAVVGIGVQAFANLNRGTGYAGVVAFVQLGWMP